MPVRCPWPYRIALLTPLTLTSIVAAAPPLMEDFDTPESIAGWQIADMNCNGSFLSPLNYYPVTWQSTGGSPGGFLHTEDPTSNCYYIMANPATFSGDLSAYDGGRIGWSVRASVSNYDLARSLVIVGTNNVILTSPIAVPVAGQWNRRCVELDYTSFRIGTQTGPAATPAQYESVITAVHRIYFPAEFGSTVIEAVDFDSIAIHDQCIADLNGDGIVNADDLGILLNAFGQSAYGDMDCNGITDADDLGILLNAFGSTCD